MASDTTNIRPRVKEAGELFLSLPESERSYKTVADRMDVTEGRAGVYVREYLTLTDQLDKAPQRGRRSGNGSGSVGDEFTKVIERTIEQYEHQADVLETALAEAKEAVATFDPDEFKASAATELRDAIAEMQARLTAWENDEGEVATKSAADTLADLVKRADTLENESGRKITFLRTQQEAAQSSLDALTEAAAEMARAEAEAKAAAETGNTEG